MPCLSWPRRGRIDLCAGIEEFAQAIELQRFLGYRGGRAQGREYGAGERHAGIRHQSERHVLYQRHLRLFACPRQRGGRAGAARKARTEARGIYEGGGRLSWRETLTWTRGIQ